MTNEIIKKFDEQFKAKDFTVHDNCELLIDENSLFDGIKDFIFSELQALKADMLKDLQKQLKDEMELLAMGGIMQSINIVDESFKKIGIK